MKIVNYEEKKVFLINITVLAISVFLIVTVSRFVIIYLFPFVIGAILAFAIQNPAKKAASKIHCKAGTVAAVLVAVIYLFCACIFAFAVWKSTLFAQRIVLELPKMLQNFQPKLDRLIERFSVLRNRLPDEYGSAVESTIQNAVDSIITELTEFISGFAANLAGNVPSVLFSTVVTVAASCYIAKDFNALKSFFKGFLSQKTTEKIINIKNIVSNDILKFVGGYFILAVITYAELLIGFLLIRVRFAPMIALLTVLVDILPVLGSGTVLVPWAIFAMLNGNFLRGILLIILYVVITVIRYFIEPKIVGQKFGIRPLFMLLVMFLGLKIGGLGGLLFFPIVFVVVIDYYKQQINEEQPLTDHSFQA